MSLKNNKMRNTEITVIVDDLLFVVPKDKSVKLTNNNTLEIPLSEVQVKQLEQKGKIR